MLLFFAVLACTEPPEAELLLEPDAARDGLEGRDGPHGVAMFETFTLARVDDPVRYRVTFPADADGAVAADAPETLPVFVMVHGGFVDMERYQWVGEHLATRGYATLLADHDLDLSLLTAENSDVALEDLYRDAEAPLHPLYGRIAEEPVAVMGHSLGGVTAASLWANDPERYGYLGIFASFPAGDTDVEQFTDRPSLHLVGTEDEPEDKKANGFDRFNPPRLFGVVDGMNHYAWCDDVTEAELANDGVASRPVDALRLDTLSVLDTWLDAWMRDDADAMTRLETGSFSGVEVEQ